MKVLSTVVLGVATLLLAQTSSTMSPRSPPAGLSDKRSVPANVQRLDAKGALAFVKLSLSLARASEPRQLSLANRVTYQRAIEEVYWRHRIWPNERPDPKPSLDEVMPPAQMEKKVEDYLRNSELLDEYWQRPLSAEQLQAEMERMAQHTKQPEVLRELFEALNNDPFVIAECLARPALSERLLTSFYAHDERFHGELKRRAEADLRTHLPAVALAEPGHTVKQMKQTSGKYSEIELVRSDNEEDEENRGAQPGVKLTNREWNENVQKLAERFNKPGVAKASALGVRRHVAAFESAGMSAHSKKAVAEDYRTIPVGKLSSLQEDEERYYATAIVKKSKDRLRLATIEWRKEPLESWKARAENQMPKVMAATSANFTLPTISDGANGCYDDAWTATSTTNAPSGRELHTAVWTGSEMIIWGGFDNGFPVSYFNTGGKYNPGTDTWTATSTANAPSTRDSHTAVWTGSEMIVWGGYFFDGSDHYLNTGGRYNPTTNSWTATSTTNAPSARDSHTAVWTGSEMIVWGGYFFDGSDHYLNTGGRYNPTTNSWIATSTTNAPSARASHTAVWTGSEMIVWGGYNNQNFYLNTGGRYKRSSSSWTATAATNFTVRAYHTAVWTGSEMIVWGGFNGAVFLNSGGIYNPSTNSWTATSTTNAPFARGNHTAVWTDSEMIVWGGLYLNTGGRYNPSTDSWIATSTTSAPSGRALHTAVWIGSEMVVWGGYNGSVVLNTGGRYTPSADWKATSITNVPSARYDHTAVWTGSEMIIWGGYDGTSYFNTGGRYTPGTDTWVAISTTNAPIARAIHTSVWTGNEMIVWGGYFFDGNGDHYLNTGGRYNPSTDSWIATNTTNVPFGRAEHTAVWTGNEMIVWGGHNISSSLNTGGKYTPGTDSWMATTTSNAPSARYAHTAVWTGSEMIVWGGVAGSSYVNTGGRYNPSSNTWTATTITNAPSQRADHTAVWSGSEMIVWGGSFFDGTNHYLNTGGRYDPGTNSWTTTRITNAPTGRTFHTAVGTGSEMVVWGGADASEYLNTGGKYNPNMDSWTATGSYAAPSARALHTGVWTGSEMIVWGGQDSLGNALNTGGRYCTQAPGCVPPPSGMVAWYPGDGNANDIQGGNNGTLINGAGFAPGEVEQAFNLHAANAQAVTVPDSNSLRVQHLTLDGWVNFDSTVGGGCCNILFEKSFAHDVNAPYAMWYEGNALHGQTSTNGSTFTNLNFSFTPVLGQWYHVAYTFDGTTHVLYVDGQQVASGANNTPPAYDSGDFLIGAKLENGNRTYYFDGKIDEVELFNRALSQAEIQAIYNAGSSGKCKPPQPTAAFSRKTHGAAGTFDVPLPLTGNVGIECRSGGATNDYQMIINFATTVTVESASVTSGTGSVSSFTVNASQVTVNLTGVTNAQRITVTLFNVNDGTHMGNISVSMGVLVGDVNGNGAVNASDVSLTKSQLGQPVSGTNFREDVNVNGSINVADVAQVKANLGTSLPP